jgi:nitrogen fixation/metabolism regulation signal transduction histidine kinase
MKRSLRLLVIAGVAAGLGLFVLLAWSTASASRLAHFHELLVILNIVLTVALFAWVVGLTVKLVQDLRKNSFGARLTARFALAFALIGVFPGALIYTVSIQFMTRSIESWFNVRVDTALDAGLTLGRTAIDAQLAELDNRAKLLAPTLGRAPEIELPALLSRIRESSGASEAMMMTSSGRPIAFVTAQFGQMLPANPPLSVINQLRLSRGYTGLETIDPGGINGKPSQLVLRVIVPIDVIDSFATGPLGVTELRWLQLIKPVSETLSRNAQEVQDGYRDYQELALSRQGLRQLFGVTLTLALLLTVFAAMAVALFLSKRLVQPLLNLASATEAVSAGDFRALPEPPQKDEVGVLTRSFNNMTRQLEEARRLVDTNRTQLERSKLYIEGILSNLSAGVLVFDEQFRVTTVNQGAQSILGADLRQVIGRPLETVDRLVVFTTRIKQAFSQHEAVGSGRLHWQEQFEVSFGLTAEQAAQQGDSALMAVSFANAESSQTITLLARGTHLKTDGRGDGYVLVFDDITELISVNRSVAWAEVARRMAHEIKNPLTPIQLSAERLAMKLAGKLSADDARLLDRATTTIVNQVSSLKHMVDDFREYARKPAQTYVEVDLNQIVDDVLALYGWEPTSIETPRPTDTQEIKFEVSLAHDLPNVFGDSTQLRQVIHNLMGNAREAMIDQPGVKLIKLMTEVIRTQVGASAEQRAIRLTLADSGPGFSSQILQRAFEPYTTTKAQGTGLGLAIVRKIIEEHGGHVDISNQTDGGARVTVLLTRFVGQVDAKAHTHDNT